MRSYRDYRLYLPAFVLMIGTGFVWNARSQAAMPLAAPLTGVMPDVPGYRREDQRIGDDERRIAGMSDYVSRSFWRDSVFAFSTFVSYYERQTQGKTIHSPRNCLPGAGWEILVAGHQDITIDGTKQTLNRHVLKNGAQTAVVFYWYQGRGRVVSNEYRVKWNLLRDAAVAGHTEEALVRVVVPVPQPVTAGDEAEAKRLLAQASALGADIASQLTRDVARVLPRS
jgi:EpsI family protein